MAFMGSVLLLLVVGLMGFVPPVVRAVQLTHAVDEGVAYGRTAPTDTVGIRKRVVQTVPVIYGTLTDVEIAAMTTSQIEVACVSGGDGTSKNCASAGVGDLVTVTANITTPILTPPFTTAVTASVDISRSATAEID
jgi:hypothetical protein